MGTPRANSWDDDWLDTVNAAEAHIGRRICGARMLDGAPCELASTHPSGRCRFHGGFDLTGAPPGNRNAYIHGLYSRRLKTCGDHCPLWSSCPMAAPDLETVPLPKRPVCPYEQAQYNTALADALDLSCTVRVPHPFAIHIAHNIATLQVMLGRAAAEMSNSTIVSQTQAQSEKHSCNEQIRPHINAISRIGTELRKYIALLSQCAPSEVFWNYYQARRREVREAMPGPDPGQFEYVPPDQDAIANERAQNAERKAKQAITRAVSLANDNKNEEAIKQWSKALQTDKKFTQNWTNSLRRSLKTDKKETETIYPPP